MGADGAGGVAKAGLPEHGQVEQTLYQDHGGEVADGLPCKQAPLGTRQHAMREGGSDTAAIEIHDLALLAARKDRAPAECVAAVMGDQTCGAQPIEAITLGGEMLPQVPAGRLSDAQFCDKGGIAQSPLLEILHRFRMTVEFELIEGPGSLQHAAIVRRSNLPLEEGETLVEGEMLR